MSPLSRGFKLARPLPNRTHLIGDVSPLSPVAVPPGGKKSHPNPLLRVEQPTGRAATVVGRSAASPPLHRLRATVVGL
jgi:hypothetical protein